MLIIFSYINFFVFIFVNKRLKMLSYKCFKSFVFKLQTKILMNLNLKKFTLIAITYTELVIKSSKEQRHDTNQGFKQSLRQW